VPQLSGTFRAFVSSTFEDLKEHRSLVIFALRKAGFFVDPMEDWVAATDAPKKLSMERVKACHLCVLLIAFRRGHVAEGETLSVTQLEYKAAVDHGLDVLVFMLDEHAAWPRMFDEFEKDRGIRTWRAQLTEQATVGFFNHDANSIRIEPALTRWAMDKLEGYRRMVIAANISELIGQAVVNDSNTSLKRAHSLIESVQDLVGESIRPII
jgi:hypothetical protein